MRSYTLLFYRPFLLPSFLPPPPLLPAPLPILLLPSFFTLLLPSSSQNDPVADQQEPSLGQADDSLVDFGDNQEEEFDPLKRTNSLTSSHTVGPAVNSDLIGQLAGLDLNATTTGGDNILQPSQATSQPISLQPTQTASVISIPPTTFQMRGVAFPMPTTHPMYGAVMYPHAPGVVYMQQVGG